MSAAHIGSGSVVMKGDDKIRVNVGPVRIKFTADDEIDTQADFVVTVPFNLPVGRLSHSDLETHGPDGNFRLLTVAASAGAHGEIVSVSYSLSEIS
jgi:hypothetical protein